MYDAGGNEGGGVTYITPSVGNFIMYEGQTYNEIAQTQAALNGLISGNIDPSKLSPDIINNMKYWFPDILAGVMKTDVSKVQNMTIDDIRKYFISSKSGFSLDSNTILLILGGIVGVVALILLLRR